MSDTLDFSIGPAQVAALLVLAQRGLEELYSRKNTRELLSRGGHEVGAAYYPVVAVTHLAWIASIFFLISGDAAVIWPIAAVYGFIQILRYWVIYTLGPFWTHRIITLPGSRPISHGVYGVVRHPNYIITRIETLLLPCAMGAWTLGIIFLAVWWVVLDYKEFLEDGALRGRQSLP